MNNKGFTLVELLVTMVLVGIISGIAFPAISKLRDQNKDEEYKAYEKIILNGAKIYMDDNVDIWQYTRKESKALNKSECKKLTFSDLSKYIKAYNKNGIDCDSSYVIVNKDRDYNITYQAVAICKKNSQTVYKTETEASC